MAPRIFSSQDGYPRFGPVRIIAADPGEDTLNEYEPTQEGQGEDEESAGNRCQGEGEDRMTCGEGVEVFHASSIR